MREEIKQRLDQIQRGELPVGYKRTKAGVVPVEWEEKRIGDVLTQRKTLQCISIDAPLLSFTIEEGIIDPTYKKSNNRDFLIKDMATKKFALTEVGDIIYNPANLKFGAIHRNNLCRGVVSPIYGIFHGVQNSYFMGYLLHNQRFIDYAKIYTEGPVEKLKTLSADTFKKLKVTLPPLKEQDKIAEILSAQDKLIALKEKLIEEKKRQKKYLMQQLLTGKKRLPGFDGEWEIARLKDVATYATKRSVMPQNSYLSTENILPNYSGVDFFDGDLSTEGVCFQSDDILLSNIRPYLKKVWLSDRAGICSADILVLRATKIKAKYLYYIIARDEFVDYVMSGVKGTKMPRGDKQHILQMEFDFPSLQEQSAIINILSTADRELDLLSHALNQEKQKKKALMQLLLTGIFRV